MVFLNNKYRDADYIIVSATFSNGRDVNGEYFELNWDDLTDDAKIRILKAQAESIMQSLRDFY